MTRVSYAERLWLYDHASLCFFPCIFIFIFIFVLLKDSVNFPFALDTLHTKPI
jgi:hypothetical protein